jgi:hypothetical protein
MHNPDGMYASEARNEDCVTLRDLFAAKAMQGFLSDISKFTTIASHECCAKEAYELADAMLKQRENGS